MGSVEKTTLSSGVMSMRVWAPMAARVREEPGWPWLPAMMTQSLPAGTEAIFFLLMMALLGAWKKPSRMARFLKIYLFKCLSYRLLVFSKSRNI